MGIVSETVRINKSRMTRTPQVHLNARDRHHDLVLVLALDRLAAPAEKVVAAELEYVGRQVVSLDDQVLNDGIGHGVRILNARNGHVADVLEDTGEDDLAKILEQVRLEGWLALLVVSEIGEQLLDRSRERRVVRIGVELFADELELIQNTVGVVAVAIAKQEVALVVQTVGLLVGLFLHDVALLLQCFSDVAVEVLEEVLQFGVLFGITVDLVDRVEQVIRGGAVGETLEQDLQVHQYGLVGRTQP